MPEWILCIFYSLRNQPPFRKHKGFRMDMNTISLLLICPVLLFMGCGREPHVERFSGTEPLEGVAERAPAFSVEKPDSMVSHLIWSGDSPLLILETFGTETALPGDTAALGADPFLEIEFDRLSMELQFAIATGDSVSVDSLRTLLDDPSVYIPVLFNTGGRVELKVLPGAEIQPGDTVAAVTGPPPESIFVVLPEAGHLLWPYEIEGTRLPSGGLMMVGEFPGDSTIIPGFYSVASHFIHEKSLSTFLVTTSGDTLHVTVTGNTNGTRTVYSAVPLESLILSGWN